MKNEFNHTDEELIDRYLAGECSEKEIAEVENRRQSDPFFAEKVDSMRSIYNRMRDMHEEDRIRAVVRRVSQEDNRRASVFKTVFWGSGGMIAAAVSFIVFLAYAPLDIPVQPQEIRAVRDFGKSVEEDSLENSKRRVFGLFFEAQSFLAEGELQPAILRLEQLAEIKELRPYFSEAIQWHLIVAHLKNGNTERAQLLFDKFQAPVEYEIPALDRWKVQWHLKRKRWLG